MVFPNENDHWVFTQANQAMVNGTINITRIIVLESQCRQRFLIILQGGDNVTWIHRASEALFKIHI